MKHRWILDEDGNPDEFAFESGFHNGVICRDCGKSVCVCCRPDYMEMDDCPGAPVPKHMSNADHIRATSDEELAKFLTDKPPCEACDWPDIMLRWLQQPYDGD